MSDPPVTYSLGAKVGGPGIGATAGHAVRGLERHGLLRRLLCGALAPGRLGLPPDRVRSLGLPSRALRRAAVHDPSGAVAALHDRVYDRWSARHLEPGGLFHGWSDHCLEALGRARDLGARTFVECASWHPTPRARLLREERERLGLRPRDDGRWHARALAELALADRVLVPSETAAASFARVGFDRARLIELPFGVDAERFRPAPARPPGPFRVLFVGTCGPRKGVVYLLRAFEALRWRDAELWLAGPVPREARPALRRYRNEAGVRWLGFVADPAPVYAAADVFALPTLHEGSALVCYEALASGLPVVTTPEAGSVVRDGREGFLVPPRDVDALCERLEALRADAGLRHELGRAARARALEFGWDRYGDALAEAVRRHLDGADGEAQACASR